MEETYNFKKIEKKIQIFWKKNKIFQVSEDYNKKKYYCLSMIPYPSGKLHIGHVRNYTIGDVIARFQRMLGKNVLHPIGWDAFGLPAEISAIKYNVSPKFWTYNNIKYMKKQLQSLGYSYDWNRELVTCDSSYYQWEQFFFIDLYHKGLVYKKESFINWCPQDKTVLANEQVISGRCWRCDNNIEMKKISQWFMKITNYAEELFHGCEKLKFWPLKVRNMQQNWIGRTEGVEITFLIYNTQNTVIKVFTFNPEYLIATTYILISINHPLLKVYNNIDISSILKKSTIDFIIKKDVIKEEDIYGVFTKLYAIHPLTNKLLQIWVSNLVPVDYATDSILGIPIKDFTNNILFAKKYNLPIKLLFIQDKNNVYLDTIVYFKNISYLNSILSNIKQNFSYIKEIIIQVFIKSGIGKYKIYYKLRDWSISRQRYWGAPIPMLIFPDGSIQPVCKTALPIILPVDVNLEKKSRPLIDYVSWKNIIYNNIKVMRETDTFDTFVESSWYYARYTCPKYKKNILDSKKANYWLPVDQYIGGIEHSVMHLMYFRFYHKLLRDAGLVECDEPVVNLLCQGMVVSDAFYYVSSVGKKVWIDSKQLNIERNKKGQIIKILNFEGHEVVHAGIIKMSKSKFNGIDPQEVIEKYGADTLRLFIIFAAPVEMDLEWKETGIQGAHRFLKKIWKLVYNYIKCKPQNIIFINDSELNIKQRLLKQKLHFMIKSTTYDLMYRKSLNTVISSVMKFVKYLENFQNITQEDYFLFEESLITVIKILYPFTPHICFELWNKLKCKEDIDKTFWPVLDKKYLIIEKIIFIIQVNGKLRGKIYVPLNVSQSFVQNIVYKEKIIDKYLQKSILLKTIYIPNKLINFVVKSI